MIHNLSKYIKVIDCGPDTTEVYAGGSTGVPVDTAGYDGCMFITSMTSAAAQSVVSITVEEGATTAAFVSLAVGGATATITETSVNSNRRNVIAVDVYRPKDRYLRLVGASDTTDGLFDIKAVLYGPSKQPAAQTTVWVPSSSAYVSVATPTT